MWRLLGKLLSKELCWFVLSQESSPSDRRRADSYRRERSGFHQAPDFRSSSKSPSGAACWEGEFQRCPRHRLLLLSVGEVSRLNAEAEEGFLSSVSPVKRLSRI